MTFTDTVVLATAWLNQPKLGTQPARTLLVGAATLTIRRRFDAFAFDLQVHSTTVTDNVAETMLWLSENLWGRPARLLLWRSEDIVVPSLITSAETAADAIAGAKLLRQLDRAFEGEVVDVAATHARATSFDAVAHAHGLPFIALTRTNLAEAHRTGCHGQIREHLAERVKAMWQLWLHEQPDEQALQAETTAWIADQTEVTA